MSDLKPIMPAINARDAALIQRALETIPAKCRYHGDKIVVDYGLCGDGSCCDTGRPSMYRKFAEEALWRAVSGDR